MLTYRYAKGADGTAFDILGMEDKTRRTGAPYSCYGCGGELIPNIPKSSKTKYYSHKADQSCSKETYLHKLAKAIFYESYTEALKLGQPFFIKFQRKTVCTAFQDSLSHECRGSEVSEFDLTKAYKAIAIEKRFGEFIPDITLISDKHPPIFIEMMVTHASTKEKIESGAKIIEIIISNEDDIQAFRKKIIDAFGESFKTYQIKPKPRIDNICGGGCTQEVEFFVLYHSGKARIISAPIREFYEKRSIYKIIAPCVTLYTSASDGYKKLVANLRHHLIAGQPIKNCLVCAHQGIGATSGIWCRAKSTKILSADAITCKLYEPFKSFVEAETAEKKNMAEHVARGNELVERMIRGYK